MSNTNWKLLLHTTDGSRITYSLVQYEWKGDRKTSSGFAMMSTCQPEELSAVLDGVADYVLHSAPFQFPLPGLA